MPEPMSDDERWLRHMDRGETQDAAWNSHEQRNASIESVYHEALAKEWLRYMHLLEAIKAKYAPE